MALNSHKVGKSIFQKLEGCSDRECLCLQAPCRTQLGCEEWGVEPEGPGFWCLPHFLLLPADSLKPQSPHMQTETAPCLLPGVEMTIRRNREISSMLPVLTGGHLVPHQASSEAACSSGLQSGRLVGLGQSHLLNSAFPGGNMLPPG